MNREDIIRMAREAGFFVNEKAREHQPNCISHTYHMIDPQLERFAALVEAAEREACAKVVENHALGYAEPVWALKLIDTIRARGQA